MKKEDNFKTTTNPHVYKNDRINRLQLSGCPRCSPHRGCNRWHKKMRSWKDITTQKKTVVMKRKRILDKTTNRRIYHILGVVDDDPYNDGCIICPIYDHCRKHIHMKKCKQQQKSI